MKKNQSERRERIRKSLGNTSWLLKQAGSIKKFIVIFVGINIITMVVSLASTVAGKYVVDAATGYGNQFFYKYILIMLGTSLFSIVLSLFSGIYNSYATEKAAFGMRAEMFDRVQRSLWKHIAKFHSGDMLNRLTSDIGSITSGLLSMCSSILVTLLQILIVLIVLLKYDPTMALFGLIIGPVGAVIAILYRKKYSMYQKDLKASESEYYSFFQEYLANLPIVKSFQLEGRNNLYFTGLRKRRMDLVLKSSKLSNAMGSLMRLVYRIGYVLAFSYCAYRLSTATTSFNAAGELVASYTYGTMTLFLSLMTQLTASIRSLGSVIPQFYSMLISAGRVRDITELPEEDYTAHNTQPSKVGVEIKDVTFAYDAETILRNINLTVKPNERVGIIGSSGAGKTTLIRLLLSLVSPDSGSIFYTTDDNGQSEPASPTARRLISYVPQGNTLLSGSVRQNLLLAKQDATEEEMWAALDAADASDFLKKLPDGLDVVLAEKAGGISEGQAQRIAIARAFIRDCPVLILDEATSALDEDTEARILESVSKLQNKTCFIITHRPSMLQYCDRVLRIRPDGTAELTDR